jgi:uncharacterized protein (UPF0332 family)
LSLAQDHLTLARHLTTHEARRPRQATLRRSISTAYYALFHLLTEAAAQSLVGKTGLGELRYLVERGFDHGAMRQCCRTFAAGNLPASMTGLISSPISAELRLVASTFHQIQDARHEADYNTARRYTRQETNDLVAQVEQAFAAWKVVRREPEAKVFLVSLLLWRQWNRP